MADDDLSYFKQRAEQEQALAQASGPAAACHRLMAQRYENRVRALERRSLGLAPNDQNNRHHHQHP
jgi:hypothetical protein